MLFYLQFPDDKKTVVITYYDGLGRPIEKIANKQSNSGKNIVTPITYDEIGRQIKDYLPYVSQDNSLNYDTSAITNIGTYYNTPIYENTLNPFSEKQYEASPLNKVLKQSFPGNDWVLNSGHEVKYDYLTNTFADVVKVYKATSTWNASYMIYYDVAITVSNIYGANMLFKNVTKNENWVSTDLKNNTTEEYKDKEGHILLKRSFENNTPFETYYVYDQFGNLSFVIPPIVDTSQTITSTILDNLCYQYKYDGKNRLVEKKLPGKQWEFIVYDKLDRIVATGPSFSPFKDFTGVGWNTSKYDCFNRVAYTGWFQNMQANFDSTTRKQIQDMYNSISVLSESRVDQSVNVDNVIINYTNLVFPTNSLKLLTVNYYDYYSPAINPSTLPTTIENQNVMANVKGMPTVTWTRIAENLNTAVFEKNMILYDYKYRPISNYNLNHLGGYTQVNSKLDFSGKTDYTITTHKRIPSDNEITIRDEFTYSAQDRLVTHTHKINTDQTQLLNKNEYDELGQLIVKRVGGIDLTGTSPLQKVDYKYNIRGWLTNINDIINLNNVADPQDLFAFKLGYNSSYSTLAGMVPLYNGNISEAYWLTASDNILRKYNYQYDALSRLRNAVYQKPNSATAITNSYNESMTYDKNGNIKTLQRNGEYDDPVNVLQIDDLDYIYDPNKANQLNKVNDYTNYPKGFKDLTNPLTNNDYQYDENGNMISDYNKGITSITYNHLNLPTKIIFGASGTIEYLYNAVGEKLLKTITTGTIVNSTQYFDGFQYLDAGGTGYSLDFFPTSEGYIKNTVVNGSNNFNYIFNYTDHLGNVRLSYTKDPDGGTTPIVLEENNYYPFGLNHKNYNMSQRTYNKSGQGNIQVCNNCPTGYKYKYNGKEFQEEMGLNIYDYGARNYDPALGRWMNIDPLAEKNRRHSPYAYTVNNPVYYIDPDGMLQAPNGSDKNDDLKGKRRNAFDDFFNNGFENENGKYREDDPNHPPSDNDSSISDDFSKFNDETHYFADKGTKDDKKKSTKKKSTKKGKSKNDDSDDEQSISGGILAGGLTLAAETSELPPAAVGIVGGTLVIVGVIKLYEGVDAVFRYAANFKNNFAQRGTNNGRLQQDELESILAKAAAGTATSAELQKLKKHQKNTGERSSRQSKDRK